MMKTRSQSKVPLTDEPEDTRVADRRWLAAILAGYVALALVYNAVTPVGASPDEGPHAEYVRYLVEQRRFPVFGEPGVTYEAHQPPLYYLLAAPVWAAVGAVVGERPASPPGDAVSAAAPGTAGAGAAPGTPERGATGSQAQGQAVRVLTTLMGAAGLWLIWALARVLYRKDRWLPLAATTFAALLPMRLATAAAVTNDLLLEALFTAALLAMALMIREGYTHRRALALGAAMGAALLTKGTGVLLLPTALLALMLASRVPADTPVPSRRGRDRAPGPAPPRTQLDARAFFGGCLLAFGVAALLAGPWLFRNKMLYGDFLAQSVFEKSFEHTPLREGFLASGRMTNADYWFRLVVPYTYSSFWGVFGHMTIWMPKAVYLALLVPSGVALVGAIIHLLRARAVLDETQRATWLVLWLCLFLVVSGFLRFNTVFFQAQGRYLFPAMAVIALLTVIGWFVFVPLRARPAATLGIGLALAALSVYGAFGVIVPYVP